jgi:hypothetical protein
MSIIGSYKKPLFCRAGSKALVEEIRLGSLPRCFGGVAGRPERQISVPPLEMSGLGIASNMLAPS